MNRKIDDLGRIVIPSEMRKHIGIKNGQDVNVELVDNKVIISNPNNNSILDKLEQWLESDEVELLHTPTIEVVLKKIELLRRVDD